MNIKINSLFQFQNLTNNVSAALGLTIQIQHPKMQILQEICSPDHDGIEIIPMPHVNSTAYLENGTRGNTLDSEIDIITPDTQFLDGGAIELKVCAGYW